MPRLYGDMYVSMKNFYAFDFDSMREGFEDPNEFEVFRDGFDEFEHGQDRFKEFAFTYGHLVRSLVVEGEEPSNEQPSPLHVARFLDQMPNLRDTVMYGVFGYTTSDLESDEEENGCFRDEMAKLLERASLQTPPQDRPLQSLRYRKFCSLICAVEQ